MHAIGVVHIVGTSHNTVLNVVAIAAATRRGYSCAL
jgi:hypothetical protein